MIDELGRIRPHIKIFVALEAARTLDLQVQSIDEVKIVGALSGG
jgi:hypothetical protein